MGVRDFSVCRPFLGPSLQSFQRLANASELDLQFVLHLAFADISDAFVSSLY
jgi:hypothetical protein